MSCSHQSFLNPFFIREAVLPTQPLAVLTKHTDEVWFVEFSTSGNMLATADAAGVCIVWDVVARDTLHPVCRRVSEWRGGYTRRLIQVCASIANYFA